MTDARLRGEWLTAASHDGLSDAAYRVLHNALMHSAEQGTDGAIARRELRFLYPGVLEQSILDELEHAGFWEPTMTGYQLVGWATTLGQSTAADVEAYRQKARERMQKRRDALKAIQSAPDEKDTASEEVVPPNDPENVRANDRTNVTGDVGEARTGLASPDLTTNRHTSQSRLLAPNDVSDRLAARQGITNLQSVADSIWKHTGCSVTREQALSVGTWLLDKKSGSPPRAPQRYVVSAIARSPFEIQQFIDERTA